MIDLSLHAQERYTASVKEIEIFESLHGRIEPESLVIIRTGWDRFWEEPKRYHNNYLFPKKLQPFSLRETWLGHRHPLS